MQDKNKDGPDTDERPTADAPFVCWNCDRPLAGMLFVLATNNRGYCVNCYNEFISPLCTKCGRYITVNEEGTVFANKYYFHKTCLKCTGCETFFRSDEPFGYHLGLILCNRCLYTTYGTVCEVCQQGLVPGQMVSLHEDKHYHAECLKCLRCSKLLINEKCIIGVDKEMYCESCLANLSQLPCTRCEKPVNDSDAVVLENQVFHRSCLKCNECKNPVTNLFYTHRSQQREGGNLNVVCQWCYVHVNRQCHNCRNNIDAAANAGLPVVCYQSFYWHIMCFECFHCKENLVGQKFALKGDILCCDQCYKKLNATVPLEATHKEGTLKRKQKQTRKKHPRENQRKK